MTKKDFILIAGAIKQTRDAYIKAGDTTALNVNYGMIKNITTALATTNPAFDRARFLTACGITE